MNPVIVTIGDWSQDGHNAYSVYRYLCSHTAEQLQAAYLDSVKLTGLTFDGQSGMHGANVICAGWKNNYLTPYQVELLRRSGGIDNHYLGDIGPSGGPIDPRYIADLFIWFCGLTLKGFQFSDRRPMPLQSPGDEDEQYILNAWWGKLNITVGYGCFDAGITLARDIKSRMITVPFYMPSREKDNASNVPPYRVDMVEFDSGAIGLKSKIASHLSRWRDSECEGAMWYAPPHVFFESQKDAAKFRLMWDTETV